MRVMGQKSRSTNSKTLLVVNNNNYSFLRGINPINYLIGGILVKNLSLGHEENQGMEVKIQLSREESADSILVLITSIKGSCLKPKE